MDANRFDFLARALAFASSRRGVLRALTSGLLAIVPVALGSGNAAAKRKRKKKRKKKKGGPCVPESQVATCAGRCGTWPNNCGQFVVCPTCTDGKECLGNGSCARVCPAVCGTNCECSAFNSEVLQACQVFGLFCPDIGPPCGSTAECPPGRHCLPTGCGPNNTVEDQCYPLCSH